MVRSVLASVGLGLIATLIVGLVDLPVWVPCGSPSRLHMAFGPGFLGQVQAQDAPAHDGSVPDVPAQDAPAPDAQPQEPSSQAGTASPSPGPSPGTPPANGAPSDSAQARLAAALESLPPYEPSWEFAPYRVVIWLAVDSSAATPEPWIVEQASGLADRWEAAWGSAVRPEIVVLRGERAALVTRSLDTLTEMDLVSLDSGWIGRFDEASPAYDAGDKLVIVTVRPAGEAEGDVEIRARDFDTHLRAFTSEPRTRVGHPEGVMPLMLACVGEAFHPIARVEEVYDETEDVEQNGRTVRRKTDLARVRWRAAGLVGGASRFEGDDQPRLRPPVGLPLQPVLRVNDRLGRVRGTGPDIVPWTYCIERAGDRIESECVIYSGLTVPMGSRVSRRTERFVYATYPRDEPTDLIVRARGPGGAAGEELVGYDIYAREPDGDVTDLVGRTDWRGACVVPPNGPMLRILYVKHGGRLLARLPTVPGITSQVTALVPRDDERLSAEGAVRSLQNEFMDIVARRQVALVRIKKMIENQRIEDARKTFDESIRGLPGRDELAYRLRELEQEYVSEDPAQKMRIESMLTATQEALYKFLDPSDVQDLDREILTLERSAS